MWGFFPEIDIHVPEFTGNSYLQFIGLRRTVLSYTDVEIVLKPLDKDGLIFYNGYTTDRSGDFISLGLVDGFVEFTFDLGTGPAKIRSVTSLSSQCTYLISQFVATRENMAI